MTTGWGFGPWGSTPWGLEGGELSLLSATAVRENCVRLAFSSAIRLTNDLAPRDGAHLRKYSITANTSSIGLDGLPARAVRPCKVELALVAGAGGALVDLWVDRPLSPYGSLYSVSCIEIYGAGGELLEAGASTTFDGVQAALVLPSLDRAAIAKDLANPQFAGSVVNASAVPGALLGSFVADSSGDYGTDDGLTSYRKRVLRRVFTRKGAFAHLPGYGVSVPAHVKQLGRPSDRAAFAADAEAQIALEPETEACEVALVPLGDGAFKLQVRCRVRFRDKPVELEQLITGA